MIDNPPFLEDYNPAGRLVFALTPGRTFLELFGHIKKITGRRVPALLVSMFYLRGKGGSEKLGKIRGLCDRLIVDSGIFSLRSQILKAQGVSIRVAHWKLGSAAQQQLISICQDNMTMFDQFAEEYGTFLSVNDDLLDTAIDLDVEQMLGIDKANDYYRDLSTCINPRKLMRVWHAFKRTWHDWSDWCESGDFDWLAMEGPDQHNRDVGMYTRFINKAHQHSVKVHILATTTLSFLSKVPMDSCDSSTYTVGGRWARLIMPGGRDVLVGEKYKADYGNNYSNLPLVEQKEVQEVFRYFGFTLEELSTSHEARCLFNALVFLLYYDKPMPEGITIQAVF